MVAGDAFPEIIVCLSRRQGGVIAERQNWKYGMPPSRHSMCLMANPLDECIS